MTKVADLVIANQVIKPGEETVINLKVARLPTRTRIEIPVIINRSKKPGPILLVTAGLHGDEVNGIEIVRRIIKRGYHKPTCGTIICIPVLNIYGFINFSRELPDGKDVNRSFPGSAYGSLASRIAYVLMNEIVPHIDYGIDYHTGGGRRTNIPQIRCVMDDLVNTELAAAFMAPFTIHSKLITGSFRHSAAKKGKRILVYEAGESLTFDEQAIIAGINGFRRFVSAMGMGRKLKRKERSTIFIARMRWVRAKSAGLFHSGVKLGALVKKGQRLGEITDPYGDYETKIVSPLTGYVIGINNNPVVNRGDALLHMGIEA